MSAPARPAWLALLAAALVLGAEPAATAPADGWRWEITPDPALTRLDVRWVGEGFRPREFVLANPAGAAHVSPVPEPGTQGARLEPLTAGRWSLVESPLSAASTGIGYMVDLAGLEASGSAARRVGRDLVTDPAAWLLAPARWAPERAARVVLRLPPGMELSAPWEPRPDGSWRVPHDAFAQSTRVAFVARAGVRIARDGVAADVHVLDAPHRASPGGIERWLATAIDTVAALWEGRFPVSRVQVLVEPVRPGGDPVVFGEATLAGGPAVHLLLSAAARDDDLPGEWIAVHELTHLGQPWIVKQDAWFSEGFVTYYQEVLRGRAGFFSETRAWQVLHDGFQRGRRRASPRSVAEDSAGMQATHAYHRVYWSGAALALRLDIALREATRGRRTLDDAMRLWSSPEFTGRKGWRALELLAAADRAWGISVCVAAVAPFLSESAFPRLDDLYSRLGLVVSDDTLSLVPAEADPAAAALRRSLIRPPAVPAAR